MCRIPKHKAPEQRTLPFHLYTEFLRAARMTISTLSETMTTEVGGYRAGPLRALSSWQCRLGGAIQQVLHHVQSVRAGM